VKSVDDLVELYFTSVGRNSKLLLNVPPTRDGVLHETDVAHLAGMGERLRAMFREDLAAGHRLEWRSTGARSAVGEMDLGRSVMVGIADLREEIARGQLVARYVIEGADAGGWRELARGTTIGCRKLDRFARTTLRRVRITIGHAVARPRPVRVRLFAGD
jgi:alpha-L-fucosidase